MSLSNAIDLKKHRRTIGQRTLVAAAALAFASPLVAGLSASPLDSVPSAVKKNLNAGKSDVRLQAVHDAANAGAVAVPLLLPIAAADKEGRVRDAAFQEIIRIPGEETASAVAKELRSKNAGERAVAAEALGAMRATGEEVDEALGRAIVDKDPDVRRAAAYAAGVCKASGCTAALQGVVAGDDDQAASLAIESLSRLRGEGIQEHLVALAASDRPALRAAALAQLRFHDRDIAAEQIRIALEDPSLRDEDDPAGPVLIAAIRAATDARRSEHLRGLVELVGHPRDRIQDAAWRALRSLTEMELACEPKAWAEWFEHYGEDYRIQRGGEPRAEPSTASRATFLGAPVISDRVVFVIDYSGSMRDDGQDGRPKVDAAQDALGEVLRALPDDARFSVIIFSDLARAMGDVLEPVGPKSIQAAERFLKASAPKGYTNVHDGLAAALQFDDVDMVVLLSDGAPSAGRFEQYSRIRYHIQRQNRVRGAAITTVALTTAEKPRKFLRELAEDTGGRFIAP